MTTLRFTKDHEWVRLDGDLAVVGITDYAQSQLGDVVYVELPEIGRRVEQGKEAAVVESVKAASEVSAPTTPRSSMALWMKRHTSASSGSSTDALSPAHRSRPRGDAGSDWRRFDR